MMGTHRKIYAVTIAALSAMAVAWAADVKLEQQKPVTEKDLGGKERYLLYGSTDKPIYRSGETVYFRAVILNAADNTPLKNGQANMVVKITDPKGGIAFQGYGQAENSSGGAKWVIPDGQAGGQYTATFSSPSLGVPETTRTFDVRAYRIPRLKSQIEFAREGYGPGDAVTAVVKVTRAEGGVPNNAKITVIARVDETEVFRKSGLHIDKEGNCSTTFNLPKEISIGDGSLSFVIEDGGVTETAGKTIPILLPTMNIAFYPEGGELVAGLPCRVYVQANRPDGKPADVTGRIISTTTSFSSTHPILKTLHEGRGVVEFTPIANLDYALTLDQPSGITKTFALPPVKSFGAVLRANKEVYPYDGKIAMTVNSTADSNAGKVTVYKREVELDSQQIEPGKKLNIELDPKDSEGVLIVTVWDKNGVPLAERLVYRQPKFAVNVNITMSEGPFIPGGKVKLNIQTTDENGKPVEAVVGMTVTDDAVLEMIEKREQAPRLPVMVYLENEVKDLADAQVYLDAKNPKAAPGVDLLLGTQGWRRFILVDYPLIKEKFAPAAKRALAERIQSPIVYRGVGNVMAMNVMVKKQINQIDEKNKLFPTPPIPAPVVDKEMLKPGIADAAPAPARAPMAKMKRENFVMEQNAFVAKDRMDRAIVREYAHQVRPNRKPNDRVDFSETLYWHAGIRTGARDGKATVEFGLSDSVTVFRVMADAFGNNGALGTGDALVKSVEPFYIEPKMPQTATVGDIIELPIALINSTSETFAAVNLLVRGEGLDIVQAENGTLGAGKRERRLVRIAPKHPGVYKLIISAAAGVYSDAVTKSLTVSPKGFPIAVNHGGLIDATHPAVFRTVIPTAVEPGSMKATAKVYPTPLANMEEALNALLRQPSGCFEQTSSTNYPLVMAQQYFTSHHGIAPEKIAKAKELLNAGYKKLTGFECKQKGYEWFGGDPGHEALTAYGLMEFADMSKIMPVDPGMVTRTRQWLLDRRDGKGGFKRNERALDSFGRAPVPTTNAYIVWALLESGEDPKTLAAEIAAIKKDALDSKDSYVIALATNILYLSGDKATAAKLAEKLVKAADKSGKITGSETSITRSGGDALALETTSLAILAWLKDDAAWAASVENSMKWLFEQCKAGRFGSTQSTILVLKAINGYDRARAKPLAAGTVQLKIDGQSFGRPVVFTPETKGAIELPDFAAKMTPGNHTLELVMDNGSKMPFSIELSYYTDIPASNSECLLRLETRLSSREVREGEPLELTATIRVGKDDAPTPIAIIGIPAGLEPRHDQLKELVGAHRIDSYEVIGCDLVLYWRALKANDTRMVPISLIAVIPGTYTGPASRAYLYYTDEYKCWTSGLQVKVLPR